ncbi:isopenicillin N synthase family dioxygenase [Glaciibacter psychrotolerans]|uniref:Isopenicillin N synthase-like dioxygenase n=1 Tax=Glaciibacter psychrotolerans TaxID=670054 RepID=A0A7Z0EBT7_9MICO|nr:isopenicillin N synthase family oxygenase [Leifsonia psychrotolerans]NYJ18310.1 isopenicillin N synthase-like dioxygenase [Leifsonia psychrotolerans]
MMSAQDLNAGGREVPTIDIDRDPALVARDFDDTLREVGFFQIVNHGVDDAIADDCWNQAREFFDLSIEQKREVERPPGGHFGYFPLKAESLAQSMGMDSPGDLKESFNIGAIVPFTHTPIDEEEARQFAPNQWPSALPGMRPAWEAYYGSMLTLSNRLMSIFARALDLPAEFFAHSIDRSPSALRAINYPEQQLPIEEGQLRAGAHTDYGTLTILRQELGRGGLQVRDEPRSSWVDIPPIDGGYVINIGDLMARWTNDRWTSTVHRVVNPDAGSAVSTRRQSMPFFHNANYQALIECLPSCVAAGESPRYEPVVAGPHLAGKSMKANVAG